MTSPPRSSPARLHAPTSCSPTGTAWRCPGASPAGALCVVGGQFLGGAPTVTAARLLPGAADVVVAPVGTGGWTAGAVQALDPTGCRGADGAGWPIEVVLSRVGIADRVYPLRLSPTARAAGVDDLALPGMARCSSSCTPRAPDPGVGLAGVHFTAVKVGDHALEAQATWLPAGVRQGDVQGVAAVDVDLDGAPDLIFSLAIWTVVPDVNGALVSIQNRNDPIAFDTTPWVNLTQHPDLQPLVDPVTLRAVSLGGAAGAAVWDRDLGEIVVFWPESGRLATWRGDALGLAVREIVAADVVGSAAPDLVALAEDPRTGAGALLVYPDLGEGLPTIAWAAGSPGEAERGADHGMAVDASDPEGSVSVEWFVGAASTPAGLGADRHDPGRAPVRAGGGRFGDRPRDRCGGRLPRGRRRSEGAARAAAARGRGRLDAGDAHALARRDARRARGRGVVRLRPAGDVRLGDLRRARGARNARRRASLLAAGRSTSREASYPALLAGAPAVTLVASDDTGVTSPPATLSLALDATGLVDVVHDADEAALAAGDVAVLRTRLRSRSRCRCRASGSRTRCTASRLRARRASWARAP